VVPQRNATIDVRLFQPFFAVAAFLFEPESTLPLTHFSDLGLAEPLMRALAAKGYATPTPIQAQAIPFVRDGHDLVGLAQTGTGKTAAFALPILHRLAQNRRHAGARGCRALVLAPTRELASQITQSFRAYGQNLGLSATVVFGGVPIGRQFKALERGVDILVATPGRLLDLIEQRGARIDGIEILVLDEADHMMDLGFIHALKRIQKMIPAERQTLLFSATMPEEIADLARAFVRDPVHVEVTPPATTVERIDQIVIHVDQMRKQDLLHEILKEPSISRALVFTRTKHGADRVVKKLDTIGIRAAAIHGNKSQSQRERALDDFKRGRARLLIATDIAARGIDVDGVTHVINFDLPDVPEAYVHRIGRTARKGNDGAAISFCAPDERGNLRDIERKTRQSIEVLEHPLGLAPPQKRDPNEPRKPAQPRAAGHHGKRDERAPQRRRRRPGANGAKQRAAG
jgi:ATP-dependent RNA helicase RhlE